MTTIRSNGGCMNDYRRLICFFVRRRRVAVFLRVERSESFLAPRQNLLVGWCRRILPTNLLCRPVFTLLSS